MGLDLLADHLGVHQCVGCARPGRMLCPTCRAGVGRAATVPEIHNVDRVVAAWAYDDISRSLVLDLKVRGKRAAADVLGRSIAERVWESGSVAEALVWVPGKHSDVRGRGFDHAERIAGVVSRELGIPAVGALLRTGDRTDQTKLGARDRRANLAGAFASRRVPRKVAVVDDLVTTGATLSEAGRALRAAGADEVEGLVACLVDHPGMAITI